MICTLLHLVDRPWLVPNVAQILLVVHKKARSSTISVVNCQAFDSEQVEFICPGDVSVVELSK